MIVLKKLTWSYAFSYGKDNVIDFSASPLTQLLGLNGHGKTSIALILEEVLFNKNSKGIKKSDVINRYCKEKFYFIELEFEKDGVEYVVSTKRGSTQTVKLTEDGEDISSHTSTGTYKLIESILGMDHKTFSQIVFQSSATSLEFLTATDSVRKKFLIDLFSLGEYPERGDKFKALAKELDNKIIALTAKIDSAESWLAKNGKADLTRREDVEIPAAPTEQLARKSLLEGKLLTIVSDNKRIVQNNKYKEILDGLVVPTTLGAKPDTNTSALSTQKIQLDKTSADATAFIAKMNKLGTQCPTCLQGIDAAKVKCLVDEHAAIKTSAISTVKSLTDEINRLRAIEAEWADKVAIKEEYEKYHSLYDSSMPTQILDRTEVEAEVAALSADIASISAAILLATKTNSANSTHNARVDMLKEQIQEFQNEIVTLSAECTKLQERLSNVQVLVKTFSSSGLVAYKLECMVKDLEDNTNEYLGELSSGRFQIGFKIVGSDKLNVVITDNGNDIDILALSGGERARVNAATLLGIRKLLQSLSNNRINLLILDETIESLDIEGKEKLVEVLLDETYLNTVLISHGFSSPLLEKIQITKTNNISRVENGRSES